VRPEFQEERWFEPSSLLIGAEAEHATYYAGGYLRSILSVIGVAVVASIAVMGLAVVNAWTNPDKGWLPAVTRSQLAFVVRIDEWLSTVVFIVIVILVGLRWSLVSRRLENLEGGLLCIHSSAIVWEAAVLAHFNALRRLGWTPPSEASTTLPTFKGYTKALGAEAHQIAEYATDIHVWLERQRQPAPSPPVVTTPESPHAT